MNKMKRDGMYVDQCEPFGLTPMCSGQNKDKILSHMCLS